MLRCNRCHTKLIFKEKIDPMAAKRIEREYNVKVEEKEVHRGYVIWGYQYHNGKEWKYMALIVCPNCHKLNYVGVSKILQLLMKPFEGLIVRKTLSKLRCSLKAEV